MGRAPRIAVGDTIYHVINRANGKLTIFKTDKDYKAFETILEEAKEKFPIRVLAYCLMSNHWHLVLYPYKDGDLSKFMQWVTLTHTQRRHSFLGSVGFGHIYQGRYKSFPVQTDEYFLQLCRYVERNPVRAGLVKKAQDWRWSSVWRREQGSAEQKKLLSPWPTEPYDNYVGSLDTPQSAEEEEAIRDSINKGRPYGNDLWVTRTLKKFGLEATIRSRGRPKKGV